MANNTKLLPRISMIVAAGLGLSACGPVAQAREGQVYVAGVNGADVSTFFNGFRQSENCHVPPGTAAFAERETFTQEPGFPKVPTTRVITTGLKCGGDSSASFINGNPGNKGWKQVKDISEPVKNQLCGIKSYVPSPGLDGQCYRWGRR